MILDDPRSTAEAAQRLGAEPPRSAFGLDLPEALEDELEWGASIRPCSVSLPRRPDPCTEPDSTGLDRVGGLVHELVRHRRPRLRERARCSARAGRESRAVGGTAIETVGAQRVPKQAGQLRLEGVELGERVFANAEDDVHPRPGLSDRIGKRRQRPSRFVTVVEEVLSNWSRMRYRSAPRRRVQPESMSARGAGRGLSASGTTRRTSRSTVDSSPLTGSPLQLDTTATAAPSRRSLCVTPAEERRLPDRSGRTAR